MSSRMYRMRRMLGGAAVVLLALGSVALAEPEIGRITTAVRRGDTFIVRVALNTTSPTTVTLNGTVGETPIRQMKARVRRPGRNRRVRFVVPARRYAGRQNDSPVFLFAQVDATSGSGSDTGYTGGAIPLPCVILPGVGNELARGAYDPFRNAVNAATGRLWTVRGRRRTIFVHHYFGLSYHSNELYPMARHARRLDIRASAMIRRSMFTKTDVIAHSMGGLVARAWVGRRGRGKARVVAMLGTPNEGAALAFLAHQIITDPAVRNRNDAVAVAGDVLGGLSPVLGDAAEGEGLAGLLLNPVFVDTVSLFLPDYLFAQVQLSAKAPAAVDAPTAPFDIMELIGLDAPLSILNDIEPDPDARFHAVCYTSTPFGLTTEGIDVTTFLGTQDIADLVLVDGPGDGIVATRSALMEDVEGWSNITRWPLGVGLHSPSSEPGLETVNGYLNDPQVFGIILGAFGLLTGK